ncbi:MAG: hypothetical protein Ct9H300mP28_21120 [Pseudomonadota bacterium]|nr:MAG: hypothetical protein Ct9H300mP28_21120 [Pseudomonadota bacterium]
MAKPKALEDKGLWSRSSIIQSKCHLQLGNYEEALKSIRLSPESKIKDAWLFQKIRILLQASRHREAIVEIRKLLKHQKKNYYLVSLREELNKSFHTDKGTDFIYHLLHDTRNNKNLFLKDYKLHSMYTKGAELHGHKIKHEYKVLGWQYPIDEASARLSHKQLKITDLKKMTPKEINNRVRTLERLGLDIYLMNHLPQLSKGRSRNVIKKLGKSYLKALFAEKYYARIIKFYQKGILTKKWRLPKETQLYWTARSYIKRRNIPKVEAQYINWKDLILSPGISPFSMMSLPHATCWIQKLRKLNSGGNRLLKKFFQNTDLRPSQLGAWPGRTNKIITLRMLFFI